MRYMTSLLALALFCACTTVRPPVDLTNAELVDLTWTFDESTLYWPSSPSSFALQQLAWGPTPGGYFYSSFAVCTPEHGGTHLDAPIHFAEGRQTADQVPLERLVAPAVVIDVAAEAARDADYRLTRGDIERWEQEHGRIAPGTIVLLRTGWGRRWPDRKAVFGDDTPGATTDLHFPSYGEQAAQMLVGERRIAALGVDTPSIDYGQSTEFLVHRTAAAANVPGFENLASLETLPARGAWVIALPMKVGRGSGGPLRAIAIVPK